PMVERARPVISETASSPPHPAARTSPAANTRRPRSSSLEPTAFCGLPFRLRQEPGYSIAPAYVSAVTYTTWSCKDLANESLRLSAALGTASTQQENARTNDTVGVLL